MTNLDKRISKLTKEINNYSNNTINKRTTNEYTLLNKQIVECIEKIDEYTTLLNNPILDCTNKLKFNKVCDELETIMDTDISNETLHYKIKTYTRMLQLIKMCDEYIKQKHIQIVEL